jgi:chemotaxis signal transduction protein
VRAGRRERSTPLAALLGASEHADDSADTRTLLAFEVDGTLYAVDASAVEIVAASRFVARIPTGPPELIGVVSVHGRMRLAVDFARATPRGENAKWWLVVLNGDAQVAVVADRIEGLHTIPATAQGTAMQARCGDRVARLVDPERILEI